MVVKVASHDSVEVRMPGMSTVVILCQNQRKDKKGGIFMLMIAACSLTKTVEMGLPDPLRACNENV